MPQLSSHFKEIIIPRKGITWCTAGEDLSDYMLSAYNIQSYPVLAGVSSIEFPPSRNVSKIKTIGLNGIPFVNPGWDKIKRPLMLIDIAKGIGGTAEFIHSKDLTESVTMYDSIDMYICTSTNDRGPYGVAEAAMCKIPVISTKTGFALRLKSIKTFETVEEAVEIINQLNESPEILKSYIEEVYTEVYNNLRWSQVVDNYWKPIFKKHQLLNATKETKNLIQYHNIIKNIYYLDLDSKTLRQRNTVSNIPAALHLIWVGKKDIPPYVIENLNMWRNLMPHWNVTLWTNDNLTEEYFDKDYLDFILSAPKAVQQADIMRLYIIKKYGGFYVDADVVPMRSLNDLLYVDNDIILCNDYPINTTYITNTFFGSVAEHPVLHEACKLILNADLKSDNIHMQTGPALFGRCIFMNNWKNKYPAVLNSLALYEHLPDVSEEFCNVSNKIYKLNNSNKKSINELKNLNAKYDELFNKLYNNTYHEVKHIKHSLRFGEHKYTKLWDNSSFNYDKEFHYDFIEIGTSDFNTLIEQYPNKKGISIEPIPVYFNSLPESNSVIKLNYAITKYDGTVTMNWVHPDDIVDNNLPDWIRGCNSIGSHINRDAFVSNEILRSTEVNCMTWKTLVETYKVNSVDLIKIDTEGHDHIILQQILKDCTIRNTRPKKIIFENNELANKKEIEKLTKEFILLGYNYIDDYDSILTYQS